MLQALQVLKESHAVVTKLQHRQQRKPTVPQSQLHQQQDVKLVSFALLVARFFGVILFMCGAGYLYFAIYLRQQSKNHFNSKSVCLFQ